MTLTLAQLCIRWRAEKHSSTEKNMNVDKINYFFFFYKSNIYDFMLKTAAWYIKLQQLADEWRTWEM